MFANKLSLCNCLLYADIKLLQTGQVTELFLRIYQELVKCVQFRMQNVISEIGLDANLMA